MGAGFGQVRIDAFKVEPVTVLLLLVFEGAVACIGCLEAVVCRTEGRMFSTATPLASAAVPMILPLSVKVTISPLVVVEP